MSDDALRRLAKAAGIAPRWKDVFDVEHAVAPPTLRALLAALALPADTPADLAESTARLARPPPLPPLVTAEQNAPILLAAAAARYRLEHEDGRIFEGTAEQAPGGARLPAILEPGYHRLILGDAQTTIAVAPPRCFTLADAVPHGRAWGLAVQLYGLRRPGDAGIGDFAALGLFARAAAARGAAAVAISPVHAQFSADPDRFSPYSPSSRVALNVLHSALEPHPDWQAEADALEAAPLVDWPAAGRHRLARMAALFALAQGNPAEMARLASYRAHRGEAVESHALFEALHAHFFARDPALWHWRQWPEPFRDPHRPEVARFAAEHAQEVALHAHMQMRAERGLQAAQAAARDAGMAIGLISDLAVGTDGGGSQCWSRQSETLLGLTVGAPPDLLQRAGQNWGLAAFSPHGLRAAGFTAYLDMLRAALAHAGGMRIDHAMGLNRLWVIPEGATGAEGAYLAMPETDLLRLIRLESQRHRAIVLAEDLGTVPDGFSDRLDAAGIDGMRVLWFERDRAQNFTPPGWWTRRASAMTSTHDLPTVAGWWLGADIDWRESVEQPGDRAQERAERIADRARIWQAFQASGAAHGEPPPLEHPGAAVDAAVRHIAGSACELAMLPLEDALGQVEQPNLPGTLDEHPNWRRRTPAPADKLLDAPATAARLAALEEARRS